MRRYTKEQLDLELDILEHWGVMTRKTVKEIRANKKLIEWVVGWVNNESINTKKQ